MIELNAQDYAKANILVTNKTRLRGEPTIPLALVLDTADQQAEYEENESDDNDW